MTKQFWRIPPDASLLHHRWPNEHEYVLYHGAANQTHRVAEVAGLFLEFLAAGPADPAVFQAKLRAESDELPDNMLAQVLEALYNLDVIEPVDAA